MITVLTKEEFYDTMRSKMLDVTEFADPVIDIMPYVTELVKNSILSSKILEINLVEKVFRNIDYTYEHVLVPTTDQDTFIVIVIDRNTPAINGHYKLGLTDEYDL